MTALSGGVPPALRDLFRRTINRHCSECGRRLTRIEGSAGYDPRTGRRRWTWYWGCEDAFFGYSRRYLDGRPYHDARRIPTSPVRQRLEIR